MSPVSPQVPVGWQKGRRMAGSLAVGVAGAVFGHFAGLPLPYMLGPLLFAAAAALSGAPMLIVPYGRELGQVVVGLAIGLRFTPTVALATVKLLPVMLISTCLIMLATAGAAVLMQRLAGIDRRTAFFATAAAGIIEMAVIAMQKGADSSIVAVSHLIRVTLIVATVPFVVTLFGTQGNVRAVEVAFGAEALALAGLLASGALLSLVASPLKIPNTWLLVPVLLGGIVAGLGFGPFAVPKALLTVAQVVIGTWVGSRFRRDVIGRLPRVTASAFIVTAYLLAAAMLVAWLLSTTTDLPFTTAVLAVSPAGVTEMVLTATAMHLDAETVTAFQIMRIAVVMTTIPFTFAAYEALARRLAGRQSSNDES